MNITRNNYEEFFMLYADNELSAAGRKEVEAFVAANPDMQQELDMFQQFKLNPDETVVYTGKEALMKMEQGKDAVSLANYESFFVLYADNELSNDEKAAVEDFVYHHPQLQSSFELLQQVRLRPDNGVVFENKESLYRKEKDDRVIPFRWWRLAAAAMVLLTAGIFWLTRSTTRITNGNPADGFVKNKPAVTNPQPPSLNNKETKKTGDTNHNEQPEKEMVVKKDDSKSNRQVKNVRPMNTAIASVRKKVEQDARNTRELPAPSLTDETLVNANDNNRLTASNIPSIKNETRKQADINTGIAAAASKSVADHQLTYTDTDEKEKMTVTQAVATNSDQLEVLNTSVNTKNSLRGFFRKASRLIAKKTGNGDEDSKHKSILIGGFEIAVR